MRRRSLFAASLAVAVTGCTIITSGRKVALENLPDLVQGESDASDVERALGQPESVVNDAMAQTTVYSYQYVASKVIGIGLPPWFVFGKKYDAGYQLNVALLNGFYHGYTFTEIGQTFLREPRPKTGLPNAEAPRDEAIYEAFTAPREVDIAGFAESAMEPFISRDGRYLFFNNSNEPGEKTDLFYATRIDDDHFRFVGPVAGANQPPPALDGVASMDRSGNFFFVSTRDYERTQNSLFAAKFVDGSVQNVGAVAGNISRKTAGWLTMDAEVSPDGGTLYLADAFFTGGAVPKQSDLAVARKSGGEFRRLPESDAWFRNINTPDLEYAPSISGDGKELLFTRFNFTQKRFRVMRSVRESVNEPFGAPATITAMTGFVEAPSLTSDGKSVYFHKKVGGRFRIFRATRG